MFKRKPSVNKKNLQEKLRLATEKPDTVFDLAELNLSKVPEGVFSKCKVLQKQALLLQHNLLEDLKTGGSLHDLSNLIVLDLSDNKMKTLPKDIKELKNLQRLDVSKNRIRKLPEEIGALKKLEVLNISNNELAGIPPTIKYFQKLTTLDVSSNKYLTTLPVNLCFLKLLTDFKFDVDRITYPKREFTSQGIQEIQRFFKMLKGEEYFAQDCLDSPQFEGTPPVSPSNLSMLNQEEEFEKSILEREFQKKNALEDRLKLEKDILESTTENAKLLSKAQQERQKFLSDIEKNEIEAQTALVKQFDQENQERNKLLEQLYLEENHLAETVNLVLQMSERGKRSEELLEELEQEQAKIDHLVKITTEESERLRKQEMLEAMEYVLKEMAESQKRFDDYETNKQQTMIQSLRREEEDQEDLEKVLRGKDKSQKEMVKSILKEEEKQRAAFQQLQFQKDARLGRIRQQVSMIEEELARLSTLEMQKRAEKNEDEVNSLAEMRLQTAILLSQLIDEQEKREERLKNMVVQLEEQRDETAQDYWLIQFQRLMDSKPQVLVDAENSLDVYVVEILLQSHAKEYLSHFARHKITESEMNEMTKDRLKEIGVVDTKVQESIMSSLQMQRAMNEKLVKRQDTVQVQVPQKKLDDDPMPPTYHPPSAPSVDLCSESECVVCLERQPSIVFLTCGHVCCCATCSHPLNDCPLCRQTIVQKCRLFRSN